MLSIDGEIVSVKSARFYQELLQIDLTSTEIHTAFPTKLHTSGYAIAIGDQHQGYYKIITAKQLSDETTINLTLHRQ